MFLSIEEIKSFLKIDPEDTSKDAEIMRCYNDALAEANRLCNRHFEEVTLTKKFVVDTVKSRVFMDNIPVKKVLSIKFRLLTEAEFTDLFDTLEGNIYVNEDTGAITLLNIDFDTDKEYAINYVSGYKEHEDELPDGVSKYLLYKTASNFLDSFKSDKSRFGLASENMNAQVGIGRVFKDVNVDSLIMPYKLINI